MQHILYYDNPMLVSVHEIEAKIKIYGTNLISTFICKLLKYKLKKIL